LYQNERLEAVYKKLLRGSASETGGGRAGDQGAEFRVLDRCGELLRP